ncbi:MAG: hypothetical protein PWR30_28 [Candidatus Woesearchaeota archaeon]|nr:hypothetical protein [Candidatus Woesearchaeota archaeon]
MNVLEIIKQINTSVSFVEIFGHKITFWIFFLLFLLFLGCLIYFLIIKLKNSRNDNQTLFHELFVPILIIFILCLSIFSLIISRKEFFSYNDTDLNYYSFFIRSSEGKETIKDPTTGGYGYLVILIALFEAFNVDSLLTLFPMMKVIMFSLFFLFTLTIYFYLEKSSILKRIIIITFILIQPSFIFSLYIMKSVYFLVFFSTLGTYILLKMIKENDNPLLHILFCLNFILGMFTRPEFLFFSFPMLISYWVFMFNKKRKIAHWILFYIVISLVVIDSIFILNRVDHSNRVELSIRLHEAIDKLKVFDMFYLSLTINFLLGISLIYFKETRWYSLIYIFVFISLISYDVFCDDLLYSFYFIFFGVIFLDNIRDINKLMIIGIPLIIFFAILLLTNLDYFNYLGDGSKMILLYNTYKSSNSTLFISDKEACIEYLFANSSLEIIESNNLSNARVNDLFLSRDDDEIRKVRQDFPHLILNHIMQVGRTFDLFEITTNYSEPIKSPSIT